MDHHRWMKWLAKILLITTVSSGFGVSEGACFAAKSDPAIDLLVRMHVIDAADYWIENAQEGKWCEGERVALLLTKMAQLFDSNVTRFEDVLSLLKQRSIVRNDYWRDNAVPGKRCNGQYVDNLIQEAAEPVGDVELLLRRQVPPGVVPRPAPSAFQLKDNRDHLLTKNFFVGTQTFRPTYQFTQKPRLIETCEAILELGCNVTKFELSPRYATALGNSPAPTPGIQSVRDLACDETIHRQALDMPFTHFVLWVHTFYGGENRWRDGFSKESETQEYKEIYDLTCHLLRTYSGSKKIFYLGHWEGDGFLRGSVDPVNDAKVTPTAVQGMADWLNCRQRAVDDAKRNTKYHSVQVWNYTEVNHVKLAMQGRPALVNMVLPKTNVDLVSYSCYDTQKNPDLLKEAMQFIESQVKPKDTLEGRRVFIGEYGFPAIRHSSEDQERLSQDVMIAGLEWGAPLVLYWELYNNEIDSNGRQIGYWLIDDKGKKQPAYETHQRIVQWGRKYCRDAGEDINDPGFNNRFREAAIKEIRR